MISGKIFLTIQITVCFSAANHSLHAFVTCSIRLNLL